MRALAPAVLLPFLALSALSQQAAVPPPTAITEALLRLEHVLFDEPGDGSIRAIGETYKMDHRRKGARFVPFLGSRAPRNFPLGLRAESVRLGGSELLETPEATPVRRGNDVVYDHGGAIQRWSHELHGAELLIEIPNRTDTGDLVVRFEIETELACIVQDENGWQFQAPVAGLGGVHMSHARIVDAAGCVHSQDVEVGGQSLSIVVPESFLAEARFPIVVDPWLNSIGIATTVDEDVLPDVAYDSSTDSWLIVYERVISVIDRDVYARQQNLNPVMGTTIPLATSLAKEEHPSVSNNARDGVFFVVWQGGGGNVQGRFVNATTSVAGSLLPIYGTTLEPGTLPDVGGTSELGPAGCTPCRTFFVVWREPPLVMPNGRIRGRRVLTDGTMGTILSLSPSGMDTNRPRISPSSHPGGHWVVAYERTSSGNRDIGWTLVSEGGGLEDMGSLSSDVELDDKPDVAGNGNEFMIVWQRFDSPGSNGVFGARLRKIQVLGITTLTNLSGNVNLTATEPGAVPTRNQTDPTVATDGCRFAYAYVEDDGNDLAVRASAIRGSTPLHWDESRLVLHPTGVEERHPRLCAKYSAGGGAGEYVVAIDRDSFTVPVHSDVYAISYHGTNGNLAGPSLNGIATNATGCAASPGRMPLLNVTGIPALGAEVLVTMKRISPLGPRTILIGAPLEPPLPFCGPCLLGVAPVWVSLPGATSVLISIPCDPLLLGLHIAVQGWDFGSVSPGCFIGTLPTSATDTMVLTVH